MVAMRQSSPSCRISASYIPGMRHIGEWFGGYDSSVQYLYRSSVFSKGRSTWNRGLLYFHS